LFFFLHKQKQISAVVEAKNRQTSGTKFTPQPVTIVKVHHIPPVVNQTHPNTKTKSAFTKSSKVAPWNVSIDQ